MANYIQNALKQLGGLFDQDERNGLLNLMSSPVAPSASAVNMDKMRLMNSVAEPQRMIGDMSYPTQGQQIDPSVFNVTDQNLLRPMERMGVEANPNPQIQNINLSRQNVVNPEDATLDRNLAPSTAPNARTRELVEQDLANRDDNEKDVGVLDSLGEYFGNRENMLNLALAFNSMRLNPDQGLAKVIENKLDRISDKGESNQTVDWLMANGHVDLANMVRKDPKLAQYALKEANKADRWETGTGKELKDKYGFGGLIDGKAYRYDKVSKKVEQVGGNATTINTVKPDKGYQFEYDSSGNIVKQVPIPKDKSEEEKKIEQRLESGKSIDTNIITQSADTVYDAFYDPDGSLAVIGDLGVLASNSGYTNAYRVKLGIDTLKSQASVSNLNAMRQASKTGGALGNVTERELAMLQNKSGILNQKIGDEEAFLKALQDYEKTLLMIVHGDIHDGKFTGTTTGQDIFKRNMERRNKLYKKQEETATKQDNVISYKQFMQD